MYKRQGLISLAYIDSDSYLPGANATQLYGYVVSSVSENNDINVKYKRYDVYTTDGKLVEGVKQKATTSVKKGDVYKRQRQDAYCRAVCRQHRQSQPQSWGPQALFRQYKR